MGRSAAVWKDDVHAALDELYAGLEMGRELHGGSAPLARQIERSLSRLCSLCHNEIEGERSGDRLGEAVNRCHTGLTIPCMPESEALGQAFG